MTMIRPSESASMQTKSGLARSPRGRKPALLARLIGAVVFLVVSPVSAREPWALQDSGTSVRLRGIDVVGPGVAWASGNQGQVLLTTDGGTSWKVRPVPGAESLDFRDVQGFDERRAVVLSIGPGPASRIYRTDDGGATWVESYRHSNPRGFLDALAFWDESRGLVLGDPVDGRFEVLTTNDGGRSWRPSPAAGMPPALKGEGCFAASGTCLAVAGSRMAWFGTGGAEASRVFRSTDGGRTWTAHRTPIGAGNPSSGIFSLAFRDPDRGVAVGGDFKAGSRTGPNAASTADGGRTWTLSRPHGVSGYRSAVAWSVLDANVSSPLIAVGPTGTDLSLDGGRTWKPFGSLGFHAVDLAGAGAGWAVGEEGRIARLDRETFRSRTKARENDPGPGPGHKTRLKAAVPAQPAQDAPPP